MTLATNNLTDEVGTGSPDFPNGMPTVGGDPVVESGSNTDGSWTKWADGTQRALHVKGGVTCTANGVTPINIVLPVSFVGTPAIAVSGVASSNTLSLTYRMEGGGIPSNGSVGGFAENTSPSDIVFYLSATLSGYWK